jgi:Icc-related predicted phosphoesterase
MHRTRIARWLAPASLALLLACPDKAPDKPADKPADTPADKPTDAPADKPADTPAPPPSAQAAHPECVGPRATDPVETRKLDGGKTLQRRGSTVQLAPDDDDDELVIGHLTDVKDYSPENAANLDVALKWFEQEAVDLIAITGDLGESVESIQGVLEHAAKAKVPVLALAGNRECRDHFTEAANAASKKHPNVLNMNVVRVLNTDDGSIVSLPGYYNKSYIHCADGCEYFPGDVARLRELAADATGAVKVLISHGPPKQEGDQALDRIHEEVNVGDPEITKLLKDGLFPFGLFGNIQEAGGYATDLSGKKRLPQGEYADQLYLNPGPIDHVRWEMLDGSESLGMAGLLRIKGKQASHKIYRLKPGEAKVK